jgi:hypothetical protein
VAHVLLIVLVATGGVPLSSAARATYERTVEHARYPFVIGATGPFDEVYPASVFAKRVERELAEEHVLHRFFGLSPTAASLADEFDRIENTTRASEQWSAIKSALGDDRRLIEEVFCRPLLVGRTLRARFGFDRGIHAGPHQQARQARATLLAGRDVPGASVRRLRRRPAAKATIDEVLRDAKADASLPRLIVPTETSPPAPLDLDPEVAAVLEQQLQRPGDVTTIIETHDRFEVLRLVEATDDTWKVQAVGFPKIDFEVWFEKQRLAR